jgi:hypothetical protein
MTEFELIRSLFGVRTDFGRKNGEKRSATRAQFCATRAQFCATRAQFQKVVVFRNFERRKRRFLGFGGRNCHHVGIYDILRPQKRSSEMDFEGFWRNFAHFPLKWTIFANELRLSVSVSVSCGRQQHWGLSSFKSCEHVCYVCFLQDS